MDGHPKVLKDARLELDFIEGLRGQFARSRTSMNYHELLLLKSHALTVPFPFPTQLCSGECSLPTAISC